MVVNLEAKSYLPGTVINVQLGGIEIKMRQCTWISAWLDYFSCSYCGIYLVFEADVPCLNLSKEHLRF